MFLFITHIRPTINFIDSEKKCLDHLNTKRMKVKPKKLVSESEHDHQRSRATKADKKLQESNEEEKSESDTSEVCIYIMYNEQF